jgi:GH24 family phage-related lysozyme (muramidase)
MYSLHKILLEAPDKNKKLNVLFVSDRSMDRRKGFARQLISSRIVTGEIYTKDRQDSKALSNLVEFYAASYYDLVVVLCRGVYDSDSDQLLSNLTSIIGHCHGLGIDVVLSTIATTDFADDTTSKLNLDITNNYQINQWIRRNADYVLDTELFSDDDWFEDNGIDYNRTAHENLYDQMLSIISQVDPSIDVESEIEKIQDKDDVYIVEPGNKDRKILAIQRKLVLLGYAIDDVEIDRRIYGPTTVKAVQDFKMKNGLNADDTIDKDTLVAIKNSKVDSEIGSKLKSKSAELTFVPDLSGDLIADADFNSSVEDQSTRLLVRFEGFNAEPVWDVDNWRIGHGSSTITTADGEVIHLSNDRSNRPSYVITREDAARDLNRRLRDEFIPDKVMSVLGGVDLPNGVIAALVSIAYNYGSLPSSIRSAARSGDIRAIANTIQAREVDNSGINKNRRNKEANYVLAAGGITETKQLRRNMKLFDHKNPRHIQILREEIAKIKKLIREYNENEIWDSLSIDQREELLTAVDDDLGPDLANVYAEEDWKDIPEAIQSRIDLSSTPDAAKLKEPEKDAKIYFRGIVNMLKNEENKYTNIPEVLKFLKAKLNVLSADYETIVRGLYKYLQTKSTADLMRLNIEVQEMLNSNRPYVDNNDTSNIDAWMRDLKASGQKLGD